MSGKISKTKHNVVKKIIKALEEENMRGAINIVRKVYPVGGDNSLQDKPNPFSKRQLRKKYWREVIAPQLKKEKFNAFIDIEIRWKLMQENFIEWAKTMGVKIGS
jgi:hypothetical protein